MKDLRVWGYFRFKVVGFGVFKRFGCAAFSCEIRISGAWVVQVRLTVDSSQVSGASL